MSDIGKQLIDSLKQFNHKLRRGDLLPATRVTRNDDGSYTQIEGVLDDGEFYPFDSEEARDEQD